MAVSIPNQTAIIQTCQVVLETGGRTYAARAMLDSGSTLSFITSKVATTLKAKKTPFVTSVTGLGETHAATSRFRTTLTLKSVAYEKEPPIEIHPALVTSITGNTPSSSIRPTPGDNFIQGLKLADPSFNSPGRIDLLLGQDVLSKLMRQGTLNSNDSNLYAQNTALGWVVGGYCSTPGQAATAHICCKTSADIQINDLLQAFWESEELPQQQQQALSPEEVLALDHFKESHTRLEDGRYQVRLPVRPSPPTLGESRQRAEKRFLQNKRVLSKRNKWQEFSKAVDEYHEMDHSEEIPEEDQHKPPGQSYYMPMHGVVKAGSTTTKLRVVFDCSAKTSSGSSLNDTLLPGPTLYPLLTDVVTRFRNFDIGMSADISKMFREVALDIQDRDLHRYLVENKEGHLVDTRMTRVTFGVVSSPFLATQVLRQLANDYEDEFPHAAAIIRSSFYVDDCLTGAGSLQEALELREALNTLLSKAKMTLRKWRSNSQELKQQIPEELLEKEPTQLITAPKECHRALGIHWNTESDTLHVATPELSSDDLPTKRQVLSDVARTFDVLGWFSPVTIQLKILLQDIWRLGLDWDQQLPEELACTWRNWRDKLPDLTSHPIPRVYRHPFKDRLLVQLHGFSDASQAAYAAVVYVRTTYCDTTVSTALVAAKTKVAPLKSATIPRLELCGAHLLSKLLSRVQDVLKIEPQDVFAWTDSMIVLAWIRMATHRLRVYEANRVAAIIEKVTPSHWHHVGTKDNPADLGSRGMEVTELIQSTLWWSGPDWLQLPPHQWPVTEIAHLSKLPQPLPGFKATTLTIRNPFCEELAQRYSSYEKMVKIASWILRFFHNVKKLDKTNKVTSAHLAVGELRQAETTLIKQVQEFHFHQEKKALTKDQPVSTSSAIKALNPFIDSDTLIRVGGRLANSQLQFSRKHPIILPKRAKFTKLLIRHLHISYLHSGPTTLIGILNQRFHIIGVKQLVRSITRDCVVCRKAQAKTSQQLMSDLPAVRVIPAPPFHSVGIDFAGPLTLKKGHMRKPVRVKAYLCVFICLATKAVHLEIATDLTTEAFLAAFTRFSARRGCPQDVWTDNGTNFVGAQRELEEVFKLLCQQQKKGDVWEFFNTRRINWHFSPGKAPHHGGIWEAAVKSAKGLIRKILGPLILTVEEFTTIVCDVEATLNSRPLCYMDSHSEEGLDPLTPGHFLVGRPLKALPLDHFNDLKISSLKRWNLCRRMAQEFWSRWTKEYLNTLQQRSKWKYPNRSFKVGDVVLIKDQELFIRTWPMARITACHPGKDDRVRVVTLRTAKGIYTRPITRLVLLVPAEEKETKEADEKRSPGEENEADERKSPNPSSPCRGGCSGTE